MFDQDCIVKELQFKTSRSQGAGGQNVNKVESKVTLLWDLENSACIDEEQRALLRRRLTNRLTKEHILLLECSEDRGQLRNKTLVTERFLSLIEQQLRKDKKRIATQIPRSKILERLDRKKKQSEKKKSRRKGMGWD